MGLTMMQRIKKAFLRRGAEAPKADAVPAGPTETIVQFCNQIRWKEPKAKWGGWTDSCDGGHPTLDQAMMCQDTKREIFAGKRGTNDLMAAINASFYQQAVKNGVQYQHRIIKRTAIITEEVMDTDEVAGG